MASNVTTASALTCRVQVKSDRFTNLKTHKYCVLRPIASRPYDILHTIRLNSDEHLFRSILSFYQRYICGASGRHRK